MFIFRQCTLVADIMAALQKYDPNTVIVGDDGGIFSIQEAHVDPDDDSTISNISIHSWNDADLNGGLGGPILGRVFPLSK